MPKFGVQDVDGRTWPTQGSDMGSSCLRAVYPINGPHTEIHLEGHHPRPPFVISVSLRDRPVTDSAVGIALVLVDGRRILASAWSVGIEGREASEGNG